MYTHGKSYRAGYVTPQFFLPDQAASIVKGLANNEIQHRTKLTSAIQEAIYYEIEHFSEVNFLSNGLLVVLGIQRKSKSSTLDIYFLPEANGNIAFFQQFSTHF